jgi:hypothetical protein
MIAGTAHSPGKAFIAFAREFFEALAHDDVGSALSRLDMTKRKWTGNEIRQRIGFVTGGKGLCSPSGLAQSASPTLDQPDVDEYLLSHRLPVSGSWSSSFAIFRFTRKPNTGYFYAELSRIDP